MQVLQVDRAGLPVQWLSLERAAGHIAKGNVSWTIGEPFAVLRGGTNARSGLQSILDIPPIIAVVGEEGKYRPMREPTLTRRGVLRRDRLLCAYCGTKHREDELTLDHIIPASRKGPSDWRNLVCSCKFCNGRKNDRTPEEAGMPLLFLPYVPNLHEAFILENRNILADQMSFLQSHLPAHSRVRLN